MFAEAWTWSAATVNGIKDREDWQDLGKRERKDVGVSMYICTQRMGTSLLLSLVLRGEGWLFRLRDLLAS